MKNIITRIPLFILLLLASCSKKEVLLPQVAVSGPTEIQNHSEVWVFYNDKGKDNKAEVNKNNLITSTNWILNIDRRLKMYEVVPVFQMIHTKRAKKSIHSVKGMIDYISYSNTKDKNISVFPINDKKHILLSWEELQELTREEVCDHKMVFYLNRVKIDNEIYNGLHWKKHIPADTAKSCIQLVFDSKLNYQQYTKYRLELDELLRNKNIQTAETEYFFK